MNIEETKSKIIENLKGVQDPEMGCDVYNLGLIYDIASHYPECSYGVLAIFQAFYQISLGCS